MWGNCGERKQKNPRRRHSTRVSCIEGTNNKIKALKRTTFGMTKFENFKARIMLLN